MSKSISHCLPDLRFTFSFWCISSRQELQWKAFTAGLRNIVLVKASCFWDFQIDFFSGFEHHKWNSTYLNCIGVVTHIKRQRFRGRFLWKKTKKKTMCMNKYLESEKCVFWVKRGWNDPFHTSLNCNFFMTDAVSFKKKHSCIAVPSVAFSKSL